MQFSQVAFGVREDAGAATVTVMRAGDTDKAVSVLFAAGDGTATANADYTAVSGALTFAPGETSQTFIVPIQADAVVEGTESVNLALSSPNGDAVLGASRTAVLFVADPVPATVADEMLRVAYLIPSNRAPQLTAVANLQYAVRQYHAWYGDQMERNGFGPKSFVYETQADGVTPVVYMVFVDPTDAELRGGGPNDLYNNNINAARAAGVPVLNTPGQVWLLTSESHLLNPDGSLLGTMALGASFGSGSDPGVGQIGSNSLSLFNPSALADDRPYDGLVIPEVGPYPLRFGVTFASFAGTTISSISSTGMGAALHEFSHGFGLPHDFRNDQNFHGNLMGNGFRGFRNEVFPARYANDETRLTYAEALTLNVSRYFNPTLTVTDNIRPAISVLTSGAVAPENGLVRIDFTASDAGGLAVAVLKLNGESVGELPLSGADVTTAFLTPFYTPNQANNYTISVYDSQGNRQNAGLSLTPAGGANRAPRPSFKLLPSTAEVGQPVTLDASATTDPDGTTALMVEWDLDGDGVFDTAPTTTRTLTQVFQTVGASLVRVRVTDPAGAQTVSTPLALRVTPPNTPPTITDLPDRSIQVDTSTGSIPFTVGDAETLADALLVNAVSSNPELVPDSNIVLGGTGANRTVTVTPAPGQTGTASITITVSDGGLTTSDTFVLTVNASSGLVQIIDNGDEDFSTSGEWMSFDGQGFQDDVHFRLAGTGSATATWTFTGLVPGLYRVSATWSPHANRASNAPFTLFDGSTPLVSIRINQELAPSTFSDQDVFWEDLGGPQPVAGSTLVVRLYDQADEYVIADAIRIERVGDLPPAVQIIDNDDAGFTATAGFFPFAGQGFQNDIHYAEAGGGQTADWSFTVVPGRYRISATWSEHPNRATDAPFLIRLGDVMLATVRVNQELAPGDFSAAGVFWHDLGAFDILGSQLQVQLSDQADEYVIADAIRVERLGDAPPLPAVQVLDDGSAGFSASEGFVPFTGQGLGSGVHFAAPGTGTEAATWSFLVTPGIYRLSATWTEHPNRATDALFTIQDGEFALATVLVNQEAAPDDLVADGTTWEALGSPVIVTGTTLVVWLSDQANEFVIADAIRIERIG